MAQAHSALSCSQLAARLRTGPSLGMRERESALGRKTTTSEAYDTTAPVDPGRSAIGLSVLGRHGRLINLSIFCILVSPQDILPRFFRYLSPRRRIRMAGMTFHVSQEESVHPAAKSDLNVCDISIDILDPT